MILTRQPTQTVFDQGQVVVRALSSITSEQATTIAGIVHASRQVWDVQTINDYNGYLSILIEPIIGCDEQNAFYISGTAQRLELSETQDDNLALIGTSQHQHARNATGRTYRPAIMQSHALASP